MSSSVAFSRPYVPIGTAVFQIRNASVAPRTFAIAGRRTPKLAAGARASIVATFTSRRGYAYAVAPGTAPALRGYYSVVAPCTHPSSTTITVTLTASSIQLSQPSLRCGTVKFQVTNTDTSSHDFSVDMSLLGAGGGIIVGPKIAYGRTVTQVMTFPFGGNVYYLSTQPEDDESGLSGYLAVR